MTKRGRGLVENTSAEKWKISEFKLKRNYHTYVDLKRICLTYQRNCKISTFCVVTVLWPILWVWHSWFARLGETRELYRRPILFVCHYWQWPILINCVKCYYLCVLRWLMRPILAQNCLLQIEQERSEEESSVGDALALAFRFARFCSASLILFASYSPAPFYEASPLCTILCNLFPWLCWYVKVFKGGFEGVLLSLLLTTMGAFSYLKFFIEDFLWQTFIRHSGNMACPS